jgi:hypothetical protein
MTSRAFIDRLLPAPVTGGFAMEDFWVWCGSVIQGPEGKYHMFASRWPKSSGPSPIPRKARMNFRKSSWVRAEINTGTA